MRRWFNVALIGMFAAWAGLLCPHIAAATDIPIFPTGAVYRLVGLQWGTSTQPGFNNNYFFTPLNVNESACVYIRNNNPTNSHTFTATISINSDPSNTTPSDGTWQIVASTGSAGFTAPLSPGLPTGLGASVSGAANVSINLSGSTTQAGVPDTANVSIVQTTGSCTVGNGFIGSAPQTVSSVSPLQAVSDGLSSAYYSTVNVTNPAVTSLLLAVETNNGNKSLYFSKVLISTTVAIQANIVEINTAGTACTPGSVPTNLKPLSITGALGASLVAPCTGNPSPVAPGFATFIPANVPTVIDLQGFISFPGIANGIEVTNQTAATGNVSVTIFWYEK